MIFNKLIIQITFFDKLTLKDGPKIMILEN